MPSVSWTATTSGTWSNAANWSVATGPQTGDDVAITGSLSPITVTYNAGLLMLDGLTTNNASLSVTAGTLSILNATSINGGLLVSGGAFRMAAAVANNTTVTGSIAFTGGTVSLLGGGTFLGPAGSSFTQSRANVLQINRGALTDNEQFTTLAGTVTGNGALVLNSTATTLSAGFSDSTASLMLNGGTVYLDENLSYGNAFTLGANCTLNLGGSTLTLGGLSSVNGTIANSVSNLTGTGHFNGLTLENGTELNLSGTYTQLGVINLGQTGTGTLNIGATGTLRIAADVNITNQDTAGALINAGTLIKTGGNPFNSDSIIYTAIANTGVINVATGTLLFQGPSNGVTSTLDGTLTGGGTAAFGSGDFAITDNAFKLAVARTELIGSANVTLTSTNLTYGGAFDQTGGVLVVGSPSQRGGSTLTLTGNDALDGGLLKGTGTVLSSGAVNLGGNETLEGNLTFYFGNTASSTGTGSSTVSQTSNIQLGAESDAITYANVEAGESWLLKGAASSIFGVNGTINNYGTFEKISGSGTSVVQNNLNNFGSLIVNTGMLMLSGQGGGTLSGSVSGSAALDVTGNVVFSSALNLSVGEVILDSGQITLGGNLNYAHGWSQEGGTLALGKSGGIGNTLTLSGVTSLEYGAIQGPGEVIVKGAATIGQGPIVQPESISLLQGAQLVFDGATEQSSSIALTGGSVAPTLTIGGGATYALDTNASIGVSPSSIVGTLVVNGTLAASAVGTSNLAVAVLDSGVIKVANGELNFLGPLTGTGSLVISSGGTLALNDTSFENNAISFGPGGGILTLAHPNSFDSLIRGFGSGDGIELQGLAYGAITPALSSNGDTVTLTEAGGQSASLTFATAQTGSLLLVGEGPNGGLTLFHI